MGFCSDFSQYNCVPSPLEMCLASKGSALRLLAVCLDIKKHLSELQWWFHNIEKADLFPLYAKCKDLHNPVHPAYA